MFSLVKSLNVLAGDPSGRVTGTDFAVGLAAVQLAAAAVICIVASAIDSISAPQTADCWNGKVRGWLGRHQFLNGLT